MTGVRYLPVLLLLSLTVFFAGCKTSKVSSPVKEGASYLSSKVQLTIPKNDALLVLNGTMKLKKGERAQLSLLMPILRSEIFRLDITPDEVIIVDRMNKRYVQASRDELKHILPKNADFKYLEKMLVDAAKPGGKSTLTGKELGITSMEKGKIELSDFSDQGFTMVPTEVSSKYTKIEWSDLLMMLKKL